MAECSGELQQEHIALLSRLESEIANMKITLSDFSTIKDTLIELKILNKQEIEFNKRQTASNEKFENTLTRIDNNLSGLNSRVGCLELTKNEDKIANTAKYQSKWTFYGVIVLGILSLISTIVLIIYK